MSEIPFITSKDELRTCVPVGLTLELITIAPAAAAIAEREVRPVIGDELYDQLVSAYGGGAEPIEQERLAVLLPYVQKIIANLAVADTLDISQVQISESGVLRTEKSDSKTAYHYQKLEAQQALRRAGYQAQEDLLSWLGRKLATYPEYKASEAFQAAQAFFITSAEQFDQQYSINRSRRTYRALMPLMQRAEQLQIRESLGEALFSELKAEQLAATLKPENKIILVYIRLAVAHLAIADAVHELSLETTYGGVQLSQTLATGGSSEEKKQPARARLDHLAERCEGLGRRHLDHLRSYLLEHASQTKYAAFYNSSLYPKNSPSERPRVERGHRGSGSDKRKIYGAL